MSCVKWYMAEELDLSVESIKWRTNERMHKIRWISEINGPNQSTEEPEGTISTVRWKKSTVIVWWKSAEVNSRGKWFRNSGSGILDEKKVVSGIEG